MIKEYAFSSSTFHHSESEGNTVSQNNNISTLFPTIELLVSTTYSYFFVRIRVVQTEAEVSLSECLFFSVSSKI